MGRLRGIVAALALIVLCCGNGGLTAAQAPTPMVSPDRLPDVPRTLEDPNPLFYNYSWRSFIALNWPAAIGAANRGQPDRTKAFGDASGPRVWTTWKSRYEIFQPGGTKPTDWASYEGQNPCGPGFANDVVTLSSFGAFGDFNQADFALSKLGSPLVAQNQTYVRYEVRANEPEFNSIVGKEWYIASKLPTRETFASFNNDSTSIKAAWRILTDKDTPAIRARYYVVPKAQVFDVVSGKCTAQDIALVGLHIVTKTADRPQWIWSSFEHVDNVPGQTTEPTPPTGVPFSFNDARRPQTLSPAQQPPAISNSNPPVADPSPMQVVRQRAIDPKAMAMNEAYWNLPEIKGTVWQNYMLVMTQWPSGSVLPSPDNAGLPEPDGSYTLANTTMETYFQSSRANCMGCHQLSNREGRDFVMFVNVDAFRPAVSAPSEPIASQLNGPKFPRAGLPLSADPVVKALIDLFDAPDKN
jgi:hypothetical protein